MNCNNPRIYVRPRIHGQQESPRSGGERAINPGWARRRQDFIISDDAPGQKQDGVDDVSAEPQPHRRGRPFLSLLGRRQAKRSRDRARIPPRRRRSQETRPQDQVVLDLSRWLKDDSLRQVKYFRKDDKSSERDLTQDEIFDMRDQLVSGRFRKLGSQSPDDLRQVALFVYRFET